MSFKKDAVAAGDRLMKAESGAHLSWLWVLVHCDPRRAPYTCPKQTPSSKKYLGEMIFDEL